MQKLFASAAVAGLVLLTGCMHAPALSPDVSAQAPAPANLPFSDQGLGVTLAVVVSGTIDLDPFREGMNNIMPAVVDLKLGQHAQLAVSRVEAFPMLLQCPNRLSPTDCSEINIDVEEGGLETPFDQYQFSLNNMYGSIRFKAQKVGEFMVTITPAGELGTTTALLLVRVSE